VVERAEAARPREASASRVTVRTEPRNAAGRVTMEAVVSRENLLLALRAVERNQGAAGSMG